MKLFNTQQNLSGEAIGFYGDFKGEASVVVLVDGGDLTSWKVKHCKHAETYQKVLDAKKATEEKLAKEKEDQAKIDAAAKLAAQEARKKAEAEIAKQNQKDMGDNPNKGEGADSVSSGSEETLAEK